MVKVGEAVPLLIQNPRFQCEDLDVADRAVDALGQRGLLEEHQTADDQRQRDGDVENRFDQRHTAPAGAARPGGPGES